MKIKSIEGNVIVIVFNLVKKNSILIHFIFHDDECFGPGREGRWMRNVWSGQKFSELWIYWIWTGWDERGRLHENEHQEILGTDE